MIVLKILLYILLAVFGLILIVLITPAGGELGYIDGKLSFKVKLWFIDLMDSEGGGIYGWLKKRKAKKKDKPVKPVKPKAVKEKRQKKQKKQREPYEWEKELDDIPVNDAEELFTADSSDQTVNEVTDTAEATAADDDKPSPEKKSRKKKADKSDDSFEEKEEADDDKKKSVDEKIEFIVGIWESAQRPMLKIFKGFRISDLYIDFVIADEDAYKCALKYGRFSALIYNGIAFFSQLFTVRLKTIDVQPQFGASKGRWDVGARLDFRLGTVVIAGAWFLITYIFRTFLPEKLRKRKMKKSAARQK